MAESRTFECNACRKIIEAWSDGKPYYIHFRTKRKRYAYHPSPEFDLCFGNDDPHICLECGYKFKVDSNSPISECKKCKSKDISSTFSLGGKKCPYCNKGIFILDTEKRMIS